MRCAETCGRNTPMCHYAEVTRCSTFPQSLSLLTNRSTTTFTAATHSYECHIQVQPVISQSLVELGYHKNHPLGWRLHVRVKSDLEHGPACFHFPQRRVLCSSTHAPNHMVERETKNNSDPLQLLQSWQTLQRDVGKAKC